MKSAYSYISDFGDLDYETFLYPYFALDGFNKKHSDKNPNPNILSQPHKMYR